MSKRKIPPLAVEWRQDVTTLHYMSLIEYRRETFLCVIDNIGESEITAYTLDFAKQQNIDVGDFLSLCNIWFYKSSHKYPLSFEIARLGLTERLSPMMRNYEINNVSRIIGVPFTFGFEAKPKIKRRRVIPVQQCVEVHVKKAS
jgi:hypothetical protein